MKFMTLLGRIATCGISALDLRPTALIGEWRYGFAMRDGGFAQYTDSHLLPLFAAVKARKPLPTLAIFSDASPIISLFISRDVRGGNRLATDNIGCWSQHGREAT
jgi:hypothetical protein